MSLDVGDLVDNYRLDHVIHRGRATTVFAATDLALGRRVAFKALTGAHSADEAAVARFVREAQVAASLDAHPGIVTVYKWGQAGPTPYFVTEFITGISLAELIERQPGGTGLPIGEGLDLLDQVAAAVDFAHQRGAIHRDIKPANIMVQMTEVPRRAYLVDFGITKTGERPGTGGDDADPVRLVSSSGRPTTPRQSRSLEDRSTSGPTSTPSPVRPTTSSPAGHRSAMRPTTPHASPPTCSCRSRPSPPCGQNSHRASTQSFAPRWPRIRRRATRRAWR